MDKTNKMNLPRILEIVSAGVVLIVAIVAVVSAFVSPFLQSKYETSAIVLMLAVRVASLLLITLPLAVIAVLVLCGKERETNKRIPLTVLLAVHGIGNVLIALVSSGLNVYSMINARSHMYSDSAKHEILIYYIKSIGGSLFGALLAVATVIFVLEAVWKKISWKSPWALIAITWVLLVLNFLSGFSMGVNTVFLVLLSTFLREEADTRPEPATGGYIGSFVTVGLALISFAVSTVYETVRLIAINSSSPLTDYNDVLNTMYAVNKGFGVLVFLAALTIPLVILAKKLQKNEE